MMIVVIPFGMFKLPKLLVKIWELVMWEDGILIFPTDIILKKAFYTKEMALMCSWEKDQGKNIYYNL